MVARAEAAAVTEPTVSLRAGRQKGQLLNEIIILSIKYQKNFVS